MDFISSIGWIPPSKQATENFPMCISGQAIRSATSFTTISVSTPSIT